MIIVFYDKFKLLCDKKGVSCNRAAKEIGLSDATPTKWKKTGATPSTETMRSIATYFNVPMSYLLGDTDDPEDHSKTHWAEAVSDDVPEEVIKAAFFRGSKMSREEIDRSWEDAKEFAAFKAAQRKAKDGK